MPGYKRKASLDDESAKKNQRQKGSLNSFSCDSCKKSKIKCQPLRGSEQCEACTKKGPQQPCVRTGVDNRSNDTTLAKLNAMVETFKSIYDDYYSVFLFMWDPKAHETENMSMMLRVANPTTYLPISGKTKPQNWKYPAFCNFNTEGLRLVEIRSLKDSFSHKAWTYICKLQALLNAFINGTLTNEDRNDIGATLLKIESNAGIFCNIVEDFEKMNQSVLLNPASVQDSPILAEYKNKLIHEQGLDLKLKVQEPRLPPAEVVDLTGDSPRTSPSATISFTLDPASSPSHSSWHDSSNGSQPAILAPASSPSHSSWHDSSNGSQQAILAPASSMEAPESDASTSSTVYVSSSQSSETILPSLETDDYTFDYFTQAVWGTLQDEGQNQEDWMNDEMWNEFFEGQGN
ncbi:hypothetical protein GQ53DRAFT_774464 [Thozetella sp. PMI_491]|nr:hypothetical protein GQ53DRAFT_774464 [Thozetella sp. PMI_491]